MSKNSKSKVRNSDNKRSEERQRKIKKADSTNISSYASDSRPPLERKKRTKVGNSSTFAENKNIVPVESVPLVKAKANNIAKVNQPISTKAKGTTLNNLKDNVNKLAENLKTGAQKLKTGVRKATGLQKKFDDSSEYSKLSDKKLVELLTHSNPGSDRANLVLKAIKHKADLSNRDPAQIEKLLNSSVKYASKKQYTPTETLMTAAAKYGHKEVFKALEDAGVDPKESTRIDSKGNRYSAQDYIDNPKMQAKVRHAYASEILAGTVAAIGTIAATKGAAIIPAIAALSTAALSSEIGILSLVYGTDLALLGSLIGIIEHDKGVSMSEEVILLNAKGERFNSKAVTRIKNENGSLEFKVDKNYLKKGDTIAIKTDRLDKIGGKVLSPKIADFTILNHEGKLITKGVSIQDKNGKIQLKASHDQGVSQQNRKWLNGLELVAAPIIMTAAKSVDGNITSQELKLNDKTNEIKGYQAEVNGRLSTIVTQVSTPEGIEFKVKVGMIERDVNVIVQTPRLKINGRELFDLPIYDITTLDNKGQLILQEVAQKRENGGLTVLSPNDPTLVGSISAQSRAWLDAMKPVIALPEEQKPLRDIAEKMEVLSGLANKDLGKYQRDDILKEIGKLTISINTSFKMDSKDKQETNLLEIATKLKVSDKIVSAIKLKAKEQIPSREEKIKTAPLNVEVKGRAPLLKKLTASVGSVAAGITKAVLSNLPKNNNPWFARSSEAKLDAISASSAGAKKHNNGREI